MKKFEPGISIPNNVAPKNYPQNFVYSNEWPRPHKCIGKEAPSLDKAMKDMTVYKSGV